MTAINNHEPELLRTFEDFSERGELRDYPEDGSIVWDLDTRQAGELQYVRYAPDNEPDSLITSVVLRDNGQKGELYGTWLEERPTSLEEMVQFYLRAQRDLGEAKASRLLRCVEERISQAAHRVGMISLTK